MATDKQAICNTRGRFWLSVQTIKAKNQQSRAVSSILHVVYTGCPITHNQNRATEDVISFKKYPVGILFEGRVTCVDRGLEFFLRLNWNLQWKFRCYTTFVIYSYLISESFPRVIKKNNGCCSSLQKKMFSQTAKNYETQFFLLMFIGSKIAKT